MKNINSNTWWLIPLLLLGMAVILCSCSNEATQSKHTTINHSGVERISQEEMNDLTRFSGQTVYVSVYSHIYHWREEAFDLAVTLSIRNTDFHNRIIVTSVKYYSTSGELVREYTDTPVAVSKMATLEYVIDVTDKKGGSGANFIVEWFAEKDVTDPIIESIMIGTTGQQGISFLSVGKVLTEFP